MCDGHPTEHGWIVIGMAYPNVRTRVAVVEGHRCQATVAGEPQDLQTAAPTSGTVGVGHVKAVADRHGVARVAAAKVLFRVGSSSAEAAQARRLCATDRRRRAMRMCLQEVDLHHRLLL